MIYWEHTYMQNGSIKTSETLLNAVKFRDYKKNFETEISIINSVFKSFSKKYKEPNLFLN